VDSGCRVDSDVTLVRDVADTDGIVDGAASGDSVTVRHALHAARQWHAITQRVDTERAVCSVSCDAYDVMLPLLQHLINVLLKSSSLLFICVQTLFQNRNQNSDALLSVTLFAASTINTHADVQVRHR
jgi:hypothetical protein